MRVFQRLRTIGAYEREHLETELQARYLRDAGCEAMQGFLFARPMVGDDCAALLRSRRKLVLAPQGADAGDGFAA